MSETSHSNDLLTEFEGSLARSLPIAAFLYVTASSERPSKGDYSELVAQTELLFNSLYRAQYEGKPGVEFLGVTIEEYGILATRLIKYSVDVQFREDKVIPSMFEIQSIVQDGLNSSGEYINFYLELLREMDSSVFSTTTAVRFISNAEALIAAQEQAQQDDGSNLNAAAIAVPAVVGALMIAATLYYLYLQQKRKNRTLIMEEGDAIEVKHESLNGDDTMEDSTYFGRSRSQDDGDSSCASSSYDEIEIVEDSEFEEITIDGEDEVDLKNQVGEIKKSYIATNIAEIKIRKDPPVQGSSESSADTPIQAYAVPSQSILNPLGHPFSSNITKLSGTGAALPVISGSSVQVVSSGSSRPTSPTPIWSNPNLRPVKPKEEQGQDIRELARKCDDDRSVITIDSQASSTPEFLKKFKQMGLSANPRSLREPERHPMLEDEQSILTIDSQASSTPEFLKKFKEMGLKRYKS